MWLKRGAQHSNILTFSEEKRLQQKFSSTSVKDFFHHYLEHQGRHSTLKHCDRGKLFDHIELQHVLSAIKSNINIRIDMRCSEILQAKNVPVQCNWTVNLKYNPNLYYKRKHIWFIDSSNFCYISNLSKESLTAQTQNNINNNQEKDNLTYKET